MLTPFKLFLAGLLFSVAMHFKVPAAFEIGTVFFLWILTLKFKQKELIEFAKKSMFFLAGFLSLTIVFLVWYGLKGALSQYITAALLQNVGYLSSWRPEAKADPFLVRNLPLIIRGVILLTGLALLYNYRKKINKNYIFLTAWTLFALFGVTLSERPYPHYLIQVVPPMSLLIGQLLAGRSVEQSLTVIPLFLTVLAPVYYNFWHYKSIPYYQNFVEFAVGKKDRSAYLDYFGGDTIRNYDLAEFVTQNTKDNEHVFVWGDDAATIYALSRRLPPIKYVASYHIKDFSTPEQVISALQANKPMLIVVLPKADRFSLLNLFIQNYYYELSEIQGARIYKHSEPISRLLQQIE